MSGGRTGTGDMAAWLSPGRIETISGFQRGSMLEADRRGERNEMRYDFDKMTDRRGTGSLKWDVPERELPMWVADMDFETAPEIREALRRRVEHGVFGYNVVTRDWYEAYQGWWGRRHHLEMEQDWLVFCTGVVPAISSAVRKLTTVGENVLVQTPVYNIFFNSIRNNGRNILESPLVYDGGEYSIDFGNLEEKLADPQTTLMLLCNPHNPVGKIWGRETLARIGELCARHHVLVLSDEIHCDLTDPGYEYVPFAAVSDVCRDNSVTCMAPTKAFNLAGLQTAAVMVPDPVIRHKLERGLNTDEVAEPNSFAVGAAIRVVPSQATYLLWLDCGSLTEDAGELTSFIRQDSGLYLTEGEEYGVCGKRFIRLNPACPRGRLQEGLERLKTGLERWRRL